MKTVRSEDAFPLLYPSGWKRTEKHNRERSRFKTSFSFARDLLLRELRLLGADNIIISSNVPVKRDGLPYATYREPDDVGVSVYFNLFKKQQCVPCDKWNKVVDNLYAIALCVEALRGLERWGAKNMVEASFTGFQQLPDYSVKVDYFKNCVSREECDLEYRRLAKTLHPDITGCDDGSFSEMVKQYEEKTK